MARQMYTAQTKIILSFKEEFQPNVPDAYAFLCEETGGAATGLEYYGMFGATVKAAFDRGLIPAQHKKKVISVEKAARKIYAGQPFHWLSDMGASTMCLPI